MQTSLYDRPSFAANSPSRASRAPSAKLLHHDAGALDFVQIKLDRRCRLGRRHIGRLDLAEDFALVAKQDDAPTALHPAGELLGAVFLAGTAGLHGANLRGRSEESSHHLNAKTVNISLVQLAVEPTAHG